MEHLFWQLGPMHWGALLPNLAQPLQHLQPPDLGITTSNCLKITKCLLRKAAVMQARPQLQLPTQTLWQVSNLKGCHPANLANACVLHA